MNNMEEKFYEQADEKWAKILDRTSFENSEDRWNAFLSLKNSPLFKYIELWREKAEDKSVWVVRNSQLNKHKIWEVQAAEQSLLRHKTMLSPTVGGDALTKYSNFIAFEQVNLSKVILLKRKKEEDLIFAKRVKKYNMFKAVGLEKANEFILKEMEQGDKSIDEWKEVVQSRLLQYADFLNRPRDMYNIKGHRIESFEEIMERNKIFNEILVTIEETRHVKNEDEIVDLAGRTEQKKLDVRDKNEDKRATDIEEKVEEKRQKIVATRAHIVFPVACILLFMLGFYILIQAQYLEFSWLTISCTIALVLGFGLISINNKWMYMIPFNCFKAIANFLNKRQINL